jgi:hypothetical protein
MVNDILVALGIPPLDSAIVLSPGTNNPKRKFVAEYLSNL